MPEKVPDWKEGVQLTAAAKEKGQRQRITALERTRSIRMPPFVLALYAMRLHQPRQQPVITPPRTMIFRLPGTSLPNNFEWLPHSLASITRLSLQLVFPGTGKTAITNIERARLKTAPPQSPRQLLESVQPIASVASWLFASWVTSREIPHSPRGEIVLRMEVRHLPPDACNANTAVPHVLRCT